MLGRFKSAIYNAIGGVEVDGVTVAGDARTVAGNRITGKPDSPQNGAVGTTGNRLKYAYQRPIFLQVSLTHFTHFNFLSF